MERETWDSFKGFIPDRQELQDLPFPSLPDPELSVSGQLHRPLGLPSTILAATLSHPNL